MKSTEAALRIGQAGARLGVTPHHLRQLCKCGLIEAELSPSGQWRIMLKEVERLESEGVPAAPTLIQEASEVRTTPPTRNLLSQELYAEPSRQLAKSKEKVIQLEHAVEAKRLKREAREIDRAVKEDEARARQAQRVQAWRDGYIRQVVETVPGEICSDVCGKVDDLLNRVPPFTDVTLKVAAIAEAGLRPIRQREEQARARDAHHKRIASAVQSIRLPYGATQNECEEARELALASLTASASVGATDWQFKNMLDGAIRPVVDRINARQADQERNRQLASHKSDIDLIVAGIYLFEGTSEERAEVKQRVRTALEQLPPRADYRQMQAVRDRETGPIKAVIEQRRQAERRAQQARFDLPLNRIAPPVSSVDTEPERQARHRAAADKADLHLGHINTYLKAEYKFTGGWPEQRARAVRLRPAILEALMDALEKDPNMDNRQIRECIEREVDARMS